MAPPRTRECRLSATAVQFPSEIVMNSLGWRIDDENIPGFTAECSRNGILDGRQVYAK